MKVNSLNIFQYNTLNKKITFGSETYNSKPETLTTKEFAKPSLQNIQANYSMSFKGRREIASFLEKSAELKVFKENFSDETPVQDIKTAFASDPNALTASILADGLDANNIVVRADKEQINAFAQILGDDAPDVFTRFIQLRDESGDTPLRYIQTEQIEAIASILDDKAPKVFEKVLNEKNAFGETALHYAKAPQIETYAKIFADKTEMVFANALTTRDSYGCLPIPCKQSGYKKLKALMKVAPNSTAVAMEKELPKFYRCVVGHLTYAELWSSRLGQY